MNFTNQLAVWHTYNNKINYTGAYHIEGTANEYLYSGGNSNDNFPNPNGGSCVWSEPGCPGDGGWHSFEYYLKVNSAPGVSDGVHKFWFDGNLVTNISNIQWATSSGQSSPRRLWNYIFIGGNNANAYALQSTSPEQWYAIDDFVVSTNYIGPNYVISGSSPPDTTPPSPPTLH